ncbi:unnamed protein product [Polarella glacialis]|uniref:Uncharacterized protein n=1 Tax=Polarella glacialis TaxID=89957 RepID=A0A813HFP6_POLGL|nr:unnamed protein product [Polarella glacialis]
MANAGIFNMFPLLTFCIQQVRVEQPQMVRVELLLFEISSFNRIQREAACGLCFAGAEFERSDRKATACAQVFGDFPKHTLLADVIPRAANESHPEKSSPYCLERSHYAMAFDELSGMGSGGLWIGDDRLDEGGARSSGESAWALSARFQEGLVPLSSLAHPVLTVLQPLVLAASAGLAASLAEAPHRPSETAQEVLLHIRLGLGVLDRLRTVVEAKPQTAINAAGAENGLAEASRRRAWSILEPKVLCLVQQLHAVLGGLGGFGEGGAPWLEGIGNLVSRLHLHLVTAGCAWDPDARRLRAKLLPLTDSNSVWGGLVPPLRSSAEFLLEQLLLSAALGRLPPAAAAAKKPPLVIAGLLACLTVRRQMGTAEAPAEEVLRSLVKLSIEGTPDSDRGVDASCVPTFEEVANEAAKAAAHAKLEEEEEASALRAHHTFLILETVHSLWDLASNSNPDSESFAASVSKHAAVVSKQLAKFESLPERAALKGAAAARASLVSAAAEVMVLEWAAGGVGPWVAETALGLAVRVEADGQAHGPAELGMVRQRSLLALRGHLLSALGNAFADDGVGPNPANAFLLSPATLLRSRPSWRPDQSNPPPSALVVSSGFVCAWDLNLSAVVSTHTSVANFRLHRSLLESLLGSCFAAAADGQDDVGGLYQQDWLSLCHFLAAQFHGLETLSLEKGEPEDSPLPSASRLFASAGLGLARLGVQGVLSDSERFLCEVASRLEVLRTAVEGIAVLEAPTKGSAPGIEWPMPFAGIAEAFAIPALMLLEGCCRDSARLSKSGSAVAAV